MAYLSLKHLKQLVVVLLNVFIFQCVGQYAHAQNPYYDAIYLSNLEIDVDFNITLDEEGYEIINRYLKPNQAREQSVILLEWNNSGNPFFQIVQGEEEGEESIITQFSESAKGISSGLNVTNIADGLAKFLVERVKQELTITFFEKFKKELDEFEELKTLFPKTHLLLSSIGDEIYNFSGYINMLREAFQEDLKTIIPNLRTLLKSDMLQKYFEVNPTIKYILDNALLIAEDLQNGKHPGDVLTNLKNENLNDTTIRNFSPSIRLLDLFSQSLRSEKKERYWISSDELKLLTENKIAFRIYLGLIYQQSEGIEFKNKDGSGTKEFKIILDVIGKNADVYANNKEQLKAYIQTLISNAQRVDQSLKAIKEINDQEDQKSKYAEHYEFYNASIDLFEESLKIRSIPIIDSIANFDDSGFQKYFNIARIAGDLYLDVREKNYFSATLNLNSILEKTIFDYEAELTNVLEDELTETIKEVRVLKAEIGTANPENTFFKLKTFITDRADHKNRKAFADLKDYIENINIANNESINTKTAIGYLDKIDKDLEENKASIISLLLTRHKEVLPKLIKYGNMAASIAQAENSDEVKKIIESIALPAGSASIKKRSKSNVALNAYVGLSPGMERNGDTGDYKFNLGVNAPVGVAMSWGKYKLLNNNTYKEKGSNTVFLSLIDIGAVTSFRFGDSDTEELPEIKLENIFAPGIYYVRGLPKAPISIGLGGQLGPQLRKVSIDEASNSKATFSFRIFVAVDLPLLNFYTKSR